LVSDLVRNHQSVSRRNFDPEALAINDESSRRRHREPVAELAIGGPPQERPLRNTPRNSYIAARAERFIEWCAETSRAHARRTCVRTRAKSKICAAPEGAEFSRI